ncbi:larval cuticle protein A3A-like [Penaeus chinensis]|uniref:larval cuticle protein A3A-like n=1 Tax=Penaeus chinensis TaxID=139456 RepID=UPI001FB62C5A|nr:larval cuticle protein A3A-like [Penaeus chinensis]
MAMYLILCMLTKLRFNLQHLTLRKLTLNPKWIDSGFVYKYSFLFIHLIHLSLAVLAQAWQSPISPIRTTAMSLKVILVACVAAVALADKAPVYHQPPVYAAPTYRAPEPAYHPSPYKQPEYPTVPPKYNYNYGVADGYSGVNLGHSEARDGYKTEGSYTVDLPDGRKQIVNYVDNGDGYVAEVTYEGEAQYPEYKPTYKPTYKPAPYQAPPKYPVY